jgi:hypothetical protein
MAVVVKMPPTLVRAVRLKSQQRGERTKESGVLGSQRFIQKPGKRQESVNEKKMKRK